MHELVPLRVPAEVVVVVDDEDAGVVSLHLVIEIGGRQAADAAAHDDEIVGLARIYAFPVAAVPQAVRNLPGSVVASAQPRGLSAKDFAKHTPLSAHAQKDLVRLSEEAIDYMPGLTEGEKKAKLAKTSYLSFLEDYAKVQGEVVKYLYTRPHGLFAMGIDGVPALDCWALRYPGFQGMGLTRGDAPGLSATAKPKQREPYVFHFPDGNASIARLLVRSLVPGTATGHTMEDIVTARMNYEKLDADGAKVPHPLEQHRRFRSTNCI